MFEIKEGIIRDLKTSQTISLEGICSTSLAEKSKGLVLKEGNTIDFFRSFFSSLGNGQKVVFLDKDTSPYELERIRNLYRDYLLISAEKPPVYSNEATDPNWTNDEPLLVFMSSGTTSAPKGIVHSSRNLSKKVELLRKHISKEDCFKALALLPVSFGYGLISGVLLPLSYGGEVALSDSRDLSALAKLGETVDEEETTFLTTTPALWQLVLKMSSPPKKKSLKRVLIAASPLSKSLWRQVQDWCGEQALVQNVYGMTETSGVISGPVDKEYSEGCIGVPWAAEMRIIDDELCVKTPCLFKGYEINGEFLPINPEKWFHTGDVARQEGDIFFLRGRIKTMINKGGFKVYPEDIEAVANKHQDVIDSCAFPLDDENLGEVPGLAVVLKAGRDLSKNDLHAFILDHLSAYKCPNQYFFIEKIPKNNRGKFDRNLLSKLFKR